MKMRAYLRLASAAAGLVALAGGAAATPTAGFQSSLGAGLLSGDDAAAQVFLPFDFAFFGQTYRTMNVDTNGFVTLTATPSEIALGAAEWNPTVSDFVSGPARLAPQWFDWISDVHYDTSHAGEAVVTWVGTEYNQPGTYVAQLQLYASGRIVFAYDNTDAPYATTIAGVSAGGAVDPGGVNFIGANFSDDNPAIYQLSGPRRFPTDIGVSFTPDGRGGYDVAGDPLPVTTPGGGGTGTSPPDGGVPEPASWALILAGFGATGAMLRRRRSLSAA